MRKSRFSEEQMVGILREADRDPVPQVTKRHGVRASRRSILYTWRQRFSGMTADDVKKLRQLQLEQENARLKKLLGERDLEIEVMRDHCTAKPPNIASKYWQYMT